MLKNYKILFCIVLLAFFCKSPDAYLHPQLWAEDGAIFFAQQHGLSTPQVFVPYAGYLHTIPRIISWIALPIPIKYIPFFYNYSSLLIDSIIVTISISYMRTLYGAFTCFIGFFLVPTVGDMFGTTTNVQWFSQFFLVFSLLQPLILIEKRGIRKLCENVLIILCALTGPFAVLDLAVIASFYAIGRALTSIPIKRLRLISSAVSDLILELDRPKLLLVVICATVQTVAMLTSHVGTPEDKFVLSRLELKNLQIPEYNWYSAVLSSPWSPLWFAIVIILGIILFTYLVMLWQEPTRFKSLTLILFSIGWAQPILAYVKQRQSHTLSPLSHYYYFLIVVGFCSACVLLRKLNKQVEISICVAAFLLIIFLKPQYIIKPKLVDFEWLRYANQMEGRYKKIIIPLNPNWRVTIDR